MRILFAVLLCLFMTNPVFAQSTQMSSPLYKLEIEQLNATYEADFDNVQNTMMLKDRMQFVSRGFVVAASDVARPFSFKISDTVVEFDKLSRNQSQTASTTFTVDGSGQTGYELNGYLVQELQSASGTKIKPTSCDGGANTCKPNIPKAWTRDDQYGWGYQLSTYEPDNELYSPFDSQNLMYFATDGPSGQPKLTKMNIKIQVPASLSDANYVGRLKVIAVPK